MSRCANLLILSLAFLLQGCAGPEIGDAVFHCVAFKSDKRLGKVTDAEVQYGQRVAYHRMTVGSVRTGVYCAFMPAPESFEVSWRKADGNWHVAQVPVRPLLHQSIHGKTLLFVLTPEGIDGLIEESYDQSKQFVHQDAKTLRAVTE